MIEIVYDEEKSRTEEAGRKRYELPKNIRQVGNAPGNYKIYIEDYVMTYLRKIAAPGNMSCRGAILLGKEYYQDGELVVFISGAVDAQNLEFDISMIKFNDSVWSGLYAEINKYFDDLVIVGWFLSRMGFSTNINEQMKKLHTENFPGNDKILFLMDSLECDEAFYYCENGGFVREKGYYIYYVRNEKMQNYIISRKNDEVESKRDAVVIKDRTVVENFREKEKGLKTNKKGERYGFGRVVAGVGVVCAISLGALWYVSPATFDKIQNSMFRRDKGGEVQVFMNNSDTETDSGVLDRSQNSVRSTEQTDEKINDDQTNRNVQQNAQQEQDGGADMTMEENWADKTTQTDQTEQQNQPDQTTQIETSQDVYVVEAGDTLVSIAIKMYGDQTKAEYIAAVNDIDIDTPIYEGQKIIIPYTD